MAYLLSKWEWGNDLSRQVPIFKVKIALFLDFAILIVERDDIG